MAAILHRLDTEPSAFTKEGLITIKDPSVTHQWAGQRGEMRGFGEDCCGDDLEKFFQVRA